MVKYILWLDPVRFAHWLSETLWDELEPRFERIERKLRKMATVEDVQAAIASQWEVVAPEISEVQARLRELAELIASGATTTQLQSLVEQVNASTSRIAQGVADSMNDDNTPDPTVPAPDPENPLPGPEGPSGELDENGNPV